MTCTHVTAANVRAPTGASTLYKEECTQCFQDQDGEYGVDICLTCFNGGCEAHAALHAATRAHPVALNVRRREKAKPEGAADGGDGEDGDGEPAKKITKLAIGVEGGADGVGKEYEFEYRVRCKECNVDLDEAQLDATVAQTIEIVKAAASAAVQDSMDAWEVKIQPCEHVLLLEQAARPADAPPVLTPGVTAKCDKCELTNNLWLCLTCGHVGCGRKNFDGTGGNNHGVDHGSDSGHHVVVKLGTVTPAGTADLHCYACSDEIEDPALAAHLGHLGIDVAASKITEQTTAELNLKLNLDMDWSMTREDGVPLEPMSGPFNVGIRNLGNTCYLASVVHALFEQPDFVRRYFVPSSEHEMTCRNADGHGKCFRCQMEKLAKGVCSGEYESISPSMIKSLVGAGHAEFSTARQQDAFEFHQHFVQFCSRNEHRDQGDDPTDAFAFQREQRLQCTKCNGVRYSVTNENSMTVPLPESALVSERGLDKSADAKQLPVVDLRACLEATVAPTAVEMRCAKCEQTTPFTQSFRMRTFPKTFVVQVFRFVVDSGWVATKLRSPVVVNDYAIDLEGLRATGLQDGEVELPDGAAAGAPAAAAAPEPAVDEAVAGNLSEMLGMPLAKCRKALAATGGNQDAAVNWLFEHGNDADDAMDVDAGGAAAGGADDALIAQIQDMGFTAGQAKRALHETNNSVERAVDWLFNHPETPADGGMDAIAAAGDAAAAAAAAPVGSDGPAQYSLVAAVSHKGASVHSGHYVAHVRRNGEWILFNDDKVARTPDAHPYDQAYVLYFSRSS